MALSDGRGEMRATAVQPSVDGDRCVHGALPAASCRACVAICPRNAFMLDDNGLALDTDACDGCGLCVGACPQEAIDLGERLQPLIRQVRGESTVFLACDAIAKGNEPGQVACLHGVGLSALARCHANGAHVAVVARGECRSCARSTSATIDERVGQISKLARDRGLPVMSVRDLPIGAWREERDEAANMSRRALFRGVLQPQPKVALPAALLAPGVPAGVILGHRDAATIALIAPIIDAEACTACGACIEVCPHRVLSLTTREVGAAYEADATACTGCGICVDACDVNAISLQASAPARPKPVVLDKARCGHCGVMFYRTSGKGGECATKQLCSICAKHPHHKSLFQVLP